MTKRCIIIANGDINDYSWHKSQVQETDFIVCADGGTRHAVSMGIVPNVVLGDFDSLSPEVKRVLADTRCEFYEHPEEKDMTDTELALRYSLKKNPEEIILMGSLGTRFDHSLANIFLLSDVSAHIRIKVINEQNEIMVLKEKLYLQGSPGDIVSIIPLSKELTGVSTRGLKFMLRNETLLLGTSRGVSNEMAGSEAMVEIKEGVALVIRAWDKSRNCNV
ncbi:MAG: thiamine diphosphokinase [Dehalobacterium sp.]